MIKSKAIDILKTLSTKELNEFGEFINSPFFNKNEKIIKLFDFLRKYHSAYDSPKLTKESVYNHLYPGKVYKDNEIRRCLSELLKLAKEYLSYVFLNKPGNYQKEKALLAELSTRKLQSLFKHVFDDLEKNFKTAEIEENYFKNMYDLKLARIDYELGIGIGGLDVELAIELLNNCFMHFISHGIIVTLKLGRNLLTQKLRSNFDYKDSIINKFFEKLDMENFIEEIKDYDTNLHNILRIYYLNFLIGCGLDQNDLHYKNFKKLIEENITQFSRFEKFNLMLYLENACSMKINEGKESFYEELQNVHAKMLSSNLYTSDDSNYLHVIAFRKIVETSLYLKKFDWTKTFIEEYSSRLPPDSIEHMKNYAYALLEFSKGEYGKAIEHASKVKFYEFNIKYASKIIKLKSYFELCYFEEIYYSIDSYRHTLKADEAPDWAKLRFLNFLTSLEKITKLRAENSSDEFEFKKINEVISCEDIFESDWLKEKVSGLFPSYTGESPVLKHI